MAKAIVLIIVISALSLFLPDQALAAPDSLKWSAVNLPIDGKSGNWVLANGSDAKFLTMTSDGTLYCYAGPAGTTFTLYKSVDGGYNWSYTGRVTDAIVAIAAAFEDANTIAYATSSKVYKSSDAGNTFAELPAGPGGAGSGNIEITSLAIFQQGSTSAIAVGTRDTDGGQYGGVYIFDESRSFTWADSSIGNYDAYAVAYSPAFATDGQLAAVVTNEADTFVTSRIGDGAWGQLIGDARLNKDNSAVPAPVVVDTSASIAFPSGYNATGENSVLFVAIDAGAENGDVYRINMAKSPARSTATDLDVGSNWGNGNVDITGLAVAGSGPVTHLIAGAAGSAEVYTSGDGGANWARSGKSPTGQSGTFVAISAGGDKVYAATSGTESALSCSLDGITWNQIGLIDTTISSVLDLAVSPVYESDSTMFLLTFGVKSSLWRSRSGGAQWERVLSNALVDVDSINKLKLAPDSSGVVLVSGASNSKPVLWKSTDGGQTFLPQFSADPASGTPFNIDAWVVIDDNTLLVGSYDGTNGVVYHTTSSGLFYTEKATLGGSSPCSLAVSPNYSQDGTILVGTVSGSVYWSNDGGGSFEQLPPAVPSLTGDISIAFDPGFSTNRTVYAASDTANKGIFRFIIGESTDWESIDGSLPAGSILNQLVLSPEGTLYAANSVAGDGVERCLDPTFSLNPAFETVSRGLESNASLAGLWVYKNQLWSLDTVNNRLMTCLDSLTGPPTLTFPDDKSSGIEIRNLSIDWEALSGATKYKWQLDPDADFALVATGFEGDTTASRAHLPLLEPGTTYYWRVRAMEPYLSPWSAERSFTTTLGSAATAPKLVYPEPGARNLPPKPVFQWESIYGAKDYELLISSDVSFAEPVVARVGEFAIPVTAWECDTSLSQGSTYYWKVRALNDETSSDWSSVSVFTIEPLPAPTTPEITSPSKPDSHSIPNPAPPPQTTPPLVTIETPPPSTPDWVNGFMRLGGALLIVFVAILASVVLLIVKIRRR